MPNREQHMREGSEAGALVACLGNALLQVARKQANPAYQFNPGEMIAMGLVGYGVGSLAGALPDVLEPAYHPRHRDIWHSWTTGAMLVAGAKKLNDHPAIPELGKLLTNTAVTGYVMHLCADSQTPVGIPWLTRK